LPREGRRGIFIHMDSLLTMGNCSADYELIVRQKPLHAKVFIGKEKGKSAHWNLFHESMS
jgi:hypothetical protein